MTATRRIAPLLAALVCALASPAGAQDLPPGAEHEGAAFTFTRIVDGVYHAVGTGAMAVGSNSVVIVNEEDVLLVDSHVSPAAAAVLLEELRQVTAKPVRHVVNTHFHFDHAHGNQIYPGTVEIIGHEFTRRMLASGGSVGGRTFDAFIGSLPRQIAELEAALDTVRAPERRAGLERQLRIQRSYKAATDAIRPTPPTVTLSERLTLYRGDREIRLEFFGRGHTGGDVVVFLPAERVLITGDLFSSGIPYMGDAFVPDWIETLEKLETLDFDVVVPGHGPAFREKERIGWLQAYFQDFWAQVVALHESGASVEEAARRIDLRAHAEHYPSIDGPGASAAAVARAYEVLAGGG